MIDLTWKIFSQTGNIETYLLLKELENATIQSEVVHGKTESISSLNTNM